jgi:acyl-CoA synthetase (AMP-forming)/AMP-acid ligase II
LAQIFSDIPGTPHVLPLPSIPRRCYPQEPNVCKSIPKQLGWRKRHATRWAPDEWGEQVRAAVALRPGVEPTDALADEILRFTRGRLTSFKVPRGVDFLPELPRLDTGKLQRGMLRARYWEGRSRQI